MIFWSSTCFLLKTANSQLPTTNCGTPRIVKESTVNCQLSTAN
ncbi:hypothetical protein [Microcoleus sp. CAWBG58]|nr:hypothetical protein [Microcoleus sp. CAWBG58]